MSGWTMDASDGQLQVTTGVGGAAAKMGHRLTIGFDWQATVAWESGEPVAVDLTVDVPSLEVLQGEGGVTGLTGPEKVLARSNALKSLDAKHFPVIRFVSEEVSVIEGGYRLSGELEIHGRSRPQVVEVAVEDAGATWQMTCDVTVRQSAFGVKPFSMMMGALKVADDVGVSFSALYEKDR